MAIWIVLSIFILIALIVTFVFILLHNENKKRAFINSKYHSFIKRQETASHGMAVVVRAEGGVPADGAAQARVALTLEVTPPGGKTYRAHTGWLVGLTALSYLHEGARIAVRIDAQDARIIYPAEEWAKYIPA